MVFTEEFTNIYYCLLGLEGTEGTKTCLCLGAGGHIQCQLCGGGKAAEKVLIDK